MSTKRKYGKPGEKYNSLVVLGEAAKRGEKRYVKCLCDCGGETIVRLTHIRSGQIKTCGCGRSHRKTHGMSRSPEFKSWLHMKERCHKEDNPQYHNYGGRGVEVCSEWRDDFQAFYDHIGPKPSPELTVDRVDNDGNYEPGNVRWASRQQQCRNFRCNTLLTYDGRTQCIVEWAEELGVNRGTLQTRLQRGWSTERALTQPTGKHRRKHYGLTAFGRTQTLPEWEKETGIAFKTILHRIDRLGWSTEEALTIPAVRGSNQQLRKT